MQAATRIRDWYLLRAAQRSRRGPPTEEDSFRQLSEEGLAGWGEGLATAEERRRMYRYRAMWRHEAAKVRASVLWGRPGPA